MVATHIPWESSFSTCPGVPYSDAIERADPTTITPPGSQVLGRPNSLRVGPKSNALTRLQISLVVTS